MHRIILICVCLLTAFSIEAKPRSGTYSNPDLDELRLEIDDLKQALHVTQVDLSLLDENNKKQEHSLVKQIKETNNTSVLAMQVSTLEKKVVSLEKILDKISVDLRTLNTALGQTSDQIQQLQTHLSTQDERLNEVGKLKGTLASIAKAVGERSAAPASASKTYKVKAGDSLEKIARAHHTTAESIRKINGFTHDKIIVGQELRIGNDPS